MHSKVSSTSETPMETLLESMLNILRRRFSRRSQGLSINGQSEFLTNGCTSASRVRLLQE